MADSDHEPEPPPPEARAVPSDDRLDSWKEIAAYLKRGVSTVQRWEREEGLPAHRLHHSKRSTVYAYRGELEAWWQDRGKRIDVEEAPVARPLRAWLGWLALAAGLAGAALLGGRFLSRRPLASPDPPRTTPLTSFRGLERHPALSPDGQKLAYVWNGESAGANFDVYMKDIGAQAAVRLTTSTASECCLAWSPDQSTLAYVRLLGSSGVIVVIAALGGPERRIADIAPWFGTSLRFTPDGKHLVYPDRGPGGVPFGVTLIALADGEKRRLTHPSSDFTGDAFPKVSPDGQWIAFARLHASGDVTSSDLFVVPVTGGNPRPLMAGGRFVGDLDWTRDGRELLFQAASPRESVRLWRLPRSGGTPTLVWPGGDPSATEIFVETPVEVSHAFRFSLARDVPRLALALQTYDTNIHGLETKGTASPSPVIGSSRLDDSPQISPDGRRIAFSSMRAGAQEIWICDRDGSSCGRLAAAVDGGTPRWSANGRSVLFDARPEVQSDIFSIDVDTLLTRRITTDGTDEVVPSGSRDGQWVYFGSNRTGAWQVWKAPSAGGTAVQVTRDGGFAAFEAEGGDAILYTKFDAPGIFRVPMGGGREEQLLDEPRCWGHWAVGPKGVYFLETSAARPPTLSFQAFLGGPRREVAVMGLRTPCGESTLAISPDERFLLYVGVEETSDIVQVDGFR